jgi:fumarate hydratase class I
LIFIQKGAKYEFLFLAKGGGSANKTYLYQQNKTAFERKVDGRFVRAKL